MKKKKILLMSDDLRMFSGVANVSKDVVMGTIHHYDWVQIAGAINHPEKNTIVDMSEAVKTDFGVEGGYLKLYPTDGYGNPDMLRQLIEIEKPDAILHFTDPRFWVWMYEMEHEIRQNIPIFYYNIWDDLPTPYYNANFYRSSDLLMGISKQTYGINKRILSEHDYEDWQVKYIPHGINSKKIFKMDRAHPSLDKIQKICGIDNHKFKILYLNRNIRRKNPGDVIMAYKHFMDGLSDEQRKECVLVFHTAPVDDNGTDLRAVCGALLPKEYSVVFTHDKGQFFDDRHVNYLHNVSDVYINIASNEGFGLGSCEALHTGTPIIVNVTGGLQDQCGFKNEKGEYLTAEDYVELGSNHRGEYKEHGEWVKPVFSSNISLQGSPQTPYIFDDRVQYEDAGDAMRYWYDKGSKGREEAGKRGMKFVNDEKIGMSGDMMCKNFEIYMDTAFEKWTPKEKYTLEVV